MRIALIGGRGYGSNYGGVENAITEISRLLAKRSELQIDVFGVGRKYKFVIDVQDGVTAVSVPGWVARLGHSSQVVASCMYSLIFRKPDVLLLFAAGPSLLSVCGKVFGVKTIACLRAIDSTREKHGLISKLILRAGENCAQRVADACTVNSQYTQEYFRTSSCKPVFIPNGASGSELGSDTALSEFRLTPDNYILFVARLDPGKKLDILLCAYAHVSQRIGVPLLVAGGQCADEGYMRKLKSLAVGGVIFAGHLPKEKIDPLMRNAGIFVLPSRSEGMSNSLLAAMKAGRCVVCSDIKANSDVVEGNPLAVYPLDDTFALAEKLEHYALDLGAREECGNQMRETAKRRYSWQATADQFWQLICCVHSKPERAVAGTKKER